MADSTVPGSTLEPLLNHRPVPDLAPGELAELLTESGFYPPATERREGLAALTIRPDVTVQNLYESAAEALTRADRLLVMMESDDAAAEPVLTCVALTRDLVTTAAGHLALIHRSLRGALAKR